MRETIIKQLMEDVAKREQLTNYVYDFATGLNKKDGFVSSMFHVKLNGETKENRKKKQLNLIVKLAPVNEKFRTEMPLREAFRREILFYETFVPSMQELLIKSKMPLLKTITPFYASSFVKGHEALVLENLINSKYELWDYKKQMNHEHVKFVLENYGKFHGTNFALKLENRYDFGGKISTINYNLFTITKDDKFVNFIHKQVGIAEKGLDPIEDAKVLEALQNYRMELKDFLKNISNDDDTFFTLAHGDCWSNNMMFKYENESSKTKPCDMKFIDFQLLWHGPPVTDITYFFYSSATPEMYDRLDEYKDIYYNSVAKQLKQLGHDPEKVFSRDAFEKQMKKYAKYGMTMSLMIVFVKLFKDDIKDHEDMENTEESIFDQFDAEKKELTEYYKMTNPLMRHCHKRGFI